MTVIFIDLETAGLDDDAAIIQIGAVAVDDSLQELDSFERKLIFDERRADPEALRINHYDPMVWQEQAVEPIRGVCELSGWARGYQGVQLVSKRTGRPYSVARLAGYNIARFDFPRIERLFKETQVFMPFDYRCLDVLQLALWHFQNCGLSEPANYQLGTMCQHFGIDAEEAHDALADVRLEVRLARAIRLVSKVEG